MKNSKKNKPYRYPGHAHQPTVTRSDLYDKGELVLKDTGRVDQNLEKLGKTLKKVKKKLKKRIKQMPGD